MAVALSGSLELSGSLIISGSIVSTGPITMSGSIASASFATTAATASSADNLLVRSTLTAQTLVVQTITSSVDFVTGSTRFGSTGSNTHQFTGSVSITGSLTGNNATFSGSSAYLDIKSTTTTGTVNVYGVDTSTNFLGYLVSSDNISRWRMGMVDGRKFEIKPADGSGNFSTTAAVTILSGSGFVGIGITAPPQTLTLLGGTTTPGSFGGGNYTFGIYSGSRETFAIGSDANYVYMQSFTSRPLYINQAGNNIILGSAAGANSVGIGTTNISNTLTISSGDGTFVKFGDNGYLGQYSNGAYINGGAEFNSAGTWTARHTSAASIVVNNAGAGNILFNTNTGLTTGSTFGTTERMRITSAGNVFVNNPSGVSLNGLVNNLSVSSTTYNLFDISRFSDNAFGPNFYLVKSRNGSIGGNTIVANGDNLGNINWVGANGTGFTDAASIRAEVDGTPGASNDMPGRLIFSTTADGSGATTERMRISAGGITTLSGPILSAGTQGTYALQIGEPGYNNLTLGYKQATAGYIQTWSSTALYLNQQGNAVYAGAVRLDTLSDQRIKDNVQPLTNSLDKVLQLNGKKFHLKDEPEDKIRYGFIAQDLEGILDEFVINTDMKFEKDGEVVENVKSIENWASSWAALLVEAIKELKSENDTLKERITILESK